MGRAHELHNHWNERVFSKRISNNNDQFIIHFQNYVNCVATLARLHCSYLYRWQESNLRFLKVCHAPTIQERPKERKKEKKRSSTYLYISYYAHVSTRAHNVFNTCTAQFGRINGGENREQFFFSISPYSAVTSCVRYKVSVISYKRAPRCMPFCK